MSLTVDTLKSQLRIDGTADDTFIQELLTESQDYIIHSVDSSQTIDVYETHPMFDRACALLVGHWYFNRQQSYTASRMLPLDIPFGVTEIISQLRGIMIVTPDPTTSTGVGA
ncbi:head-tail connector protein [Sporolactobacillus sp. CQH2019]|uniref:head-tail connector protein n=1 Tax=Sporolactobacillus sp. CQH2019 TaxID=3023512 RepID=UPI002368C1CF|nr:head-tail connector protein [Sporolactobacillus sp. CQH2019]MDD9147351.1 head-tail connector protein [Sporolactobacillus sp. CQH2019]